MSYAATRRLATPDNTRLGVSRMGLPPGINQARSESQVLQGLGYNLDIDTPIGKQRITIPLEKMAEDAAVMVMNAAWPIAMQKLREDLPGLMNLAYNEMQPYVRKEVDRTMNVAETKIDDTIDAAVKVGAIGLGIAIIAGTGLVIAGKIKKKRG